MLQQSELKTSFKQRLAIIIVAIVLLGSTVALYMGIVLGYNNNGSNLSTTEKQARFDELYAQYQAESTERATELSAEHFDTFLPFKSRVRSFNAAAITEVTTTDLVVGTGAEVTEGFFDYSAYYIGWLSDETIFDSSFDSTTDPTSLKLPLAGGQMIEGWNQGIIGMRLGGVREIAIPSELAYGDNDQGEIPAGSPLKFVIMLIPKVADVDWAEEMYELYAELYGNN